MRGDCRHSSLKNQRFLGTAKTTPRYKLYHLGSYPGLADSEADGREIHGEVFAVSAACLQELDLIEGVDEGLYERKQIQLVEPFAAGVVEAYFYLGDISRAIDIGERWTVQRS